MISSQLEMGFPFKQALNFLRSHPHNIFFFIGSSSTVMIITKVSPLQRRIQCWLFDLPHPLLCSNLFYFHACELVYRCRIIQLPFVSIGNKNNCIDQRTVGSPYAWGLSGALSNLLNSTGHQVTRSAGKLRLEHS